MKIYEDITKAIHDISESNIADKTSIINLLNEIQVMRNLHGTDKDEQKAMRAHRVVKVAFKEGGTVSRVYGIYDPERVQETEAEDILISGTTSDKVLTLPAGSECLNNFK
jgi:hypothetical protein